MKIYIFTATNRPEGSFDRLHNVPHIPICSYPLQLVGYLWSLFQLFADSLILVRTPGTGKNPDFNSLSQLPPKFIHRLLSATSDITEYI